MPANGTEDAFAFLFSSLFSTIEELSIKQQAYEDVLRVYAPKPEQELQEAERLIRASDRVARNKQLRFQAVQAVRDRNFDVISGLAGEIAGVTLPFRKVEKT